MKYIKKSDRTYPITESEIRASFPEISFGFPFVPPSDYAEVQPTEIPSYDLNSQIVVGKQPKLYRGVFKENWEVQDLDPATAQANAQRRIEELKTLFISEIQIHMDQTAREKGYDSILSACSYSNSLIPTFKEESDAASVWRDQVWAYCIDHLDRMQKGTRAIPTSPKEFIEELPKINW